LQSNIFAGYFLDLLSHYGCLGLADEQRNCGYTIHGCLGVVCPALARFCSANFEGLHKKEYLGFEYSD
jgi:hypothetical protein